MVAAGCGGTPAAVRTWDDEVTGAVAQVNEAMAREVVPSMVVTTPDLPRVQTACDHLAAALERLGPLAADAPSGRAKTAGRIRKLQTSLGGVASECTISAGNGDTSALVAFNKALGPKLVAAAALERDIAADLHDGSKCPPRLRATVKACKEPAKS